MVDMRFSGVAGLEGPNYSGLMLETGDITPMGSACRNETQALPVGPYFGSTTQHYTTTNAITTNREVCSVGIK